jgi:osmotically-inducible protein OsmY
VAAVRGHRHGEQLPLYVVTGEQIPARRIRNIYASGATAVFAWPAEAGLLADLLAETFGMATVRGRAEAPDVALGRTIRAHLRLGPRPGSAVRVKVRRGAVTLSGEARSLARKRRIVAAAAAVPGVTRISADGLRVANLGVADSEVERNVRAVVDATSEIDSSRLSISVRNGRVEVRGRVPSRAQFQDLLELIENVKGVRRLRYTVEIADGEPVADHLVRKRLHAALATLFSEENVELSVYRGVAVLSGRVRSLVAKRQLERLVARNDAVVRVVNKLEVFG